MAGRRCIWITIFIITVCGGLYLLGNGRVPLWDRDEPRYAMASRWMLTSGDRSITKIPLPGADVTASCEAAVGKLYGHRETAGGI